MLMRLEDLCSVHCIVSAYAFECSEAIVQCLAVQVRMSINRFNELTVQEKDRVFGVVHITIVSLYWRI